MSIQLHNYQPTEAQYRPQVVEGLQKTLKTLPNHLQFDEKGSALFEQIVGLPGYYIARAEVAIMQEYIEEIVARIGSNCLLVEYGSGSSVKTRLLLNNLPDLAGYVPIDISAEQLLMAATGIATDYPHLEVLPVCADYTQPFEIPRPRKLPARRVAYYPGTTIGNLHPPEAVSFLEKVRQHCGANGGLLLTVDLKKDPQIIEQAYNDSGGIVARFNLNILSSINHALGADFKPDQFAREAIYNEPVGRMEMYLISLHDQGVHIGDDEFLFRPGERIWMDYSYKYSMEEFAALAARAGWRVEKAWTDSNRLVSIQYLASRH